MTPAWWAEQCSLCAAAAAVSSATGQASTVAALTAAAAGVSAASQQATTFILAIQTIARAAVAQGSGQALAYGYAQTADLSGFYRYDVPAYSLHYDVPAASLRFDVPSMASDIEVS